ncbi:hypothetical protein SAMN05421789_101411 [Kaistella chaponensis]|uniref:Uncharacterized protein n=1 Tax=Kaistella chaponensis TaxID=713588 RepID=A0A1N7JCC2_9FLAO|nr:hypothetical protein [Kaistella chaponensis]SIS46978.1 hypothetical protein SAMN05421789_101411 [Kaistella chaponensis]
MKQSEFLLQIHKRISIISVGASALRNQGASGIIKIARDYLYQIDINEFVNALETESSYKLFLNVHTKRLISNFPENGKSWGAARKGLNLFFREIVYNKFFSDQYNFPKDLLEFNKKFNFLEVPLDRDVALGIYNETDMILPKWKSIKTLTQDISDLYQGAAHKIAKKEKTAKVNLDLKYWRNN